MSNNEMSMSVELDLDSILALMYVRTATGGEAWFYYALKEIDEQPPTFPEGWTFMHGDEAIYRALLKDGLNLK